MTFRLWRCFDLTASPDVKNMEFDHISCNSFPALTWVQSIHTMWPIHNFNEKFLKSDISFVQHWHRWSCTLWCLGTVNSARDLKIIFRWFFTGSTLWFLGRRLLQQASTSEPRSPSRLRNQIRCTMFKYPWIPQSSMTMIWHTPFRWSWNYQT